jgi:8-oxo-dGTP pyrophosphatase MutT (NUDIX family)
MIEPWRVLASEVTFRDRWLSVRSDTCLTPAGVEVSPYHVLEYPDWVNVVPLTRDPWRLILVREYRHGRGEVLLGLVSGAVEPSDGGGPDAAEAAARRELKEETGHAAGRLVRVLESYPNPANHNNLVTSFVAFDVAPAAPRALDPTESIEIVVDELDAVLRRLRDGQIMMQAMHVAALWSAAAYLMADEALLPPSSALRTRLRDLFFGQRNL